MKTYPLNRYTFFAWTDSGYRAVSFAARNIDEAHNYCWAFGYVPDKQSKHEVCEIDNH